MDGRKITRTIEVAQRRWEHPGDGGGSISYMGEPTSGIPEEIMHLLFDPMVKDGFESHRLVDGHWWYIKITEHTKPGYVSPYS